ncbi:hypothetical protein K1719_046085 [Acacia pycnantha]|nr:hypothetical protein K1719_046085 [Acacia pycnantha]
MAKRGTTLVKTQRIQGFYTILTSAACEWFLIFLLLINAAISYLLTKFARYGNLQSPCVLCSRIDHVLSGEKQKLGWYQNLICSNHRSEISSLVLCHVHDKVSDGHGMCDECLMSTAPDHKTHSKTHRLLLGKLGPACGDHGSQSSLTNRDTFTSSVGSRPCSCCGKFWNSIQSSQRSLLVKSPRMADFKPDFLFSDIYRKNYRNHQNNLKKICEKPCLGRRSSDSLSNYAEYTEVKLASDSESESAFSDDDNVSSQNHEDIESSNILMNQFTAVAPSKRLPSDSNLTKPHIISPETEPLILFPCGKPDVSNHPDVNSTVSDAVNDYGFGQIKWPQPNQNSLSSELPELISLNEFSPSSDVVDVRTQEPEVSTSLSQNSLPAALSELVTSDLHPLVSISPKKCDDDTQASETARASTETSGASKNHEEAFEETVIIARAPTETAPCENDSAFSSVRNDESNNVQEFPNTNEEREAPAGFVDEHRTPTEVNKVNEEPKRSHSPNSSPHGSSMPSVVPIAHVNALEMQANTSSSNGIQEIQKAPSIEPFLGSLEGFSVDEIEGESIVDQLKRQIEHCKKYISALYKDLEEERNASAVAANQSMAMITRLQEEKAALHMEALQYLRMMDEQAEYDGEELEKAYDLLSEKEKEIQDLDAELEFYRMNMEDEPMGHNMQKERCNLKEKNIKEQNFSVPPITTSSNSKSAELSQVNDESVAHETSLEFEDEKLYISNCLSSLEKKLRRISDNSVSFNMPNDRPKNFEEKESDQQGCSNGEGPRLESLKDNNVLSIKEDYTNIASRSITDQDGSIASKSEICSPCEENNHSTSTKGWKHLKLIMIF